jgi:hypothetical protein
MVDSRSLREFSTLQKPTDCCKIFKIIIWCARQVTIHEKEEKKENKSSDFESKS